jgi:hypothetical protein
VGDTNDDEDCNTSDLHQFDDCENPHAYARSMPQFSLVSSLRLCLIIQIELFL